MSEKFTNLSYFPTKTINVSHWAFLRLKNPPTLNAAKIRYTYAHFAKHLSNTCFIERPCMAFKPICTSLFSSSN